MTPGLSWAPSASQLIEFTRPELLASLSQGQSPASCPQEQAENAGIQGSRLPPSWLRRGPASGPTWQVNRPREVDGLAQGHTQGLGAGIEPSVFP